MSLKGEEGFNEFYRQMYGDRWDTLSRSLIAPKKHIAVLNPFVPYTGEKKHFSGIDYLEEDQFPAPERTLNSYMNYYLMDAASFLPIDALEIQTGDKIVDLCAAPGGKSLLCAFKLENTGLLVSNDRSAARRSRIHKIFEEYIPQTKRSNHKVTGHDATKWSLYEKSVYDKVLLDAPCSSERHVLMDKSELKNWSQGRSKAIAITQFAMLASALDIVKKQGTIVYSTCALSDWENDQIIEKLHLKRKGRFEIVEKTFPFGEKTQFGWKVLPDKTGYGPFYLSVIKRLN